MFFEPLSKTRNIWHREATNKKYQRVGSGIYNSVTTIAAISNKGELIFSDLSIYEYQKPLHVDLRLSMRHSDDQLNCVEISPCGNYLALLWYYRHVYVYEISRPDLVYNSLHVSLDELISRIEFAAVERNKRTARMFVVLGSTTNIIKKSICEWNFCRANNNNNTLQVFVDSVSDMYWISRITDEYLVRSTYNSFKIHRIDNDRKLEPAVLFGKEYKRFCGIVDDFVCLLRQEEGSMVAIDLFDLRGSHVVYSCRCTTSRSSSVAVSQDQTVIACDGMEPWFIFVLGRVYEVLLALHLSLVGGSLPLYVVLLVYDWHHAFFYGCPIESAERWQHSKKVEFLMGVQKSIRRTMEGRGK